MEIVRVAPVHDGIHQDAPPGFFDSQISKNAPQRLLVCAVDVNFPRLVDPTDAKNTAADGLFTPVSIEDIARLFRSRGSSSRRLLKKFVKSTLEPGERKIISLNLVAITMGRGGLLPHRGAEIERDDQEKNKNP